MASPSSCTRINLWSMPRCRSTALMYSFSSRNDTTVLDEPLYANHLFLNPHLKREYREKLLKENETDGTKVVEKILKEEYPSKVLFCKHMAKHFTPNLSKDLLLEAKNVFLIRDPMYALASWSSVQPATLEETGLPKMLELIGLLKEAGKPVIIVDSDILDKNPEKVLKELCKRLEIEYQEEQLSWEAGPKPFDGLWAYLWYEGTHKSTGFSSSLCFPKPFPTKLYDLLQMCFPFYHSIRREAILADIPLLSTGGSDNRQNLQGGGIIDHGQCLLLEPIEKNKTTFIWIGDRLYPREHAGVSVFDSTVQGGDAVWEGLRIYNGKAFSINEHLDRLFNSAKAMAFTHVPAREEVVDAIFRTLAANGMRDGVHLRITLSRGKKTTSSMNPIFNCYGSCLIVVPEWKPVGDAATYDNVGGVKLITASNRRNPPQCVDSKIHHCNLINNILPKISANVAGAADALMLDTEGFVSETNATNIFIVKKGVLITPHADFCLPGVTRQHIINLANELSIPLETRRVSLSECHSCDEMFTTGTMGELTPVKELDGRIIGDGTTNRPMLKRLQEAYSELTKKAGVPLPDF